MLNKGHGFQPCHVYRTRVFGEDLNQSLWRKKPQMLGNAVCILAATRFHLTLGALEPLSSRMLTVAGKGANGLPWADLLLNLSNKQRVYRRPESALPLHRRNNSRTVWSSSILSEVCYGLSYCSALVCDAWCQRATELQHVHKSLLLEKGCLEDSTFSSLNL